MRIFRGIYFNFSWKRMLGISTLKRKVATTTGIPTTRMGLNAKLGRWLWQLIFGKPKWKRRK